MGVIAQPSTSRLIGALTVVGAYDRLVVNCVIGRSPERVGGRRGWPEVTARVAAGSSGPLQVALVLTAQLRWLCFGIHVTEHRERLRNYVAGLRSQLGVPPTQPTCGELSVTWWPSSSAPRALCALGACRYPPPRSPPPSGRHTVGAPHLGNSSWLLRVARWLLIHGLTLLLS